MFEAVMAFVLKHRPVLHFRFLTCRISEMQWSMRAKSTSAQRISPSSSLFSHFNLNGNLLLPSSSSFSRSFVNYKRKGEFFQLTDMPIKDMPNMFRYIRTKFLNIFIRLNIDKQYSPKDLCAESKRAVSQVSSLISQGKFDELEDMLTGDLICKLRHRYDSLTLEERQWIAVDAADIVRVVLYEADVIFDGQTNQRFVEISISLAGTHGLEKFRSARKVDPGSKRTINMKDVFSCTYRFKREFSEGVTDDWTINQLNHFGFPKHG